MKQLINKYNIDMKSGRRYNKIIWNCYENYLGYEWNSIEVKISGQWIKHEILYKYNKR